jgi:hypothetical protein
MKKIILIISILALTGCMKTVCLTDTDCTKKVDWNDPTFTLVRTIITNGANAGN